MLLARFWMCASLEHGPPGAIAPAAPGHLWISVAVGCNTQAFAVHWQEPVTFEAGSFASVGPFRCGNVSFEGLLVGKIHLESTLMFNVKS